ncbi:transposase [Alkalibacillus haloalkaliphilus]|uniref:transposase n=1 Tax=Alkalibacillus haloalkaliphilus TaxID=94136 RepID=UPI002935FF90|nr:transposase [Alkalibacillus haloalkaliphilus]MDV2583506.1 transposase [Alkalibacillus haloalkaliphilus]
MGNRKIEIFEDLKKKYVRMALETNQYASTAKSAGVSSSTLRNWMRQYETEVLDQMESEGVRLTPPEPTEKEYKKKYEQAMKLLGEKELEVAVLKDALKKNDHQ